MRKDSKLRLFNQKANGVFLKRVDGNLTLEGVYHHNMMTRVNNNNYKIKFPTYKEVSVSKNFNDFQNFAAWCNTQLGFGTTGFVLDKDLLFPNNKIYSEDTCIFVPDVINSFLTFNKSMSNGLPVGVSWCNSENCYKSYCAQLNGKNKTLGRFTSPEKAHEVYCEFKESLAYKLADKYSDSIDPRAVVALKTFKVANYIKENT